MPATTTPPLHDRDTHATVYSPGDLLDLGERCPTRCVTWSTDGTCWGLTRDTRRKPRRPETVVYRIVAPVDDPEAWTEGPGVVPEPAPAGAGAPPPALPPAPPEAADPPSDPVDMVRSVFGPDVAVAADPDELARLTRKLLDAQRRRDPGVLEADAWTRLDAALAAGATGDLIAAGRAVIGWCEDEDPERLGLGGWKRFTAQVEGFEGVDTGERTRLMRWRCQCPPGQTGANSPCCSQQHHRAS